MTREDIIRNLKYTMEKHKNDTVNTFGTNISAMCKDILDYLEQEPCDVFDEYGNYKYPSDVELTEPNTATSMPCEDAIGRSVMLDSIGHGTTYTSADLQRIIKDLPSVNPQPKTGHWIKDDITERSKSAYKHKCDRCGAYHRAMYDYCPSCGARMFEPQGRSEA